MIRAYLAQQEGDTVHEGKALVQVFDWQRRKCNKTAHDALIELTFAAKGRISRIALLAYNPNNVWWLIEFGQCGTVVIQVFERKLDHVVDILGRHDWILPEAKDVIGESRFTLLDASHERITQIRDMVASQIQATGRIPDATQAITGKK